MTLSEEDTHQIQRMVEAGIALEKLRQIKEELARETDAMYKTGIAGLITGVGITMLFVGFLLGKAVG